MRLPQIINPENKSIKKDDLRYYLFSSHLYILCLLVHVSLLFFFYFIKVYLMAGFNVFSCILFTANLFFNKKGWLSLAYHLAISEITVHAALSTMCLGWNSNFSFYSVAICSVIMFSTFLKTPVKIIEVVLSSMLLMSAFFYLTRHPTIYTVDNSTIIVVGFINILVIISLLSSIFYKFYKETAILNKKLKTFAETDALTGVYNRRFFNEYLSIESKRLFSELTYNVSTKEQRNFGLAIIDIDDFKKINDTYGHIAGDDVLVQVVNIIKKNTFSRDVMCRYGGEEFVILFTRTIQDGVIQTCEKIRADVELQNIVFNGDKKGKVTISIGVSFFDENRSENNIEWLIDLADKRLLQAKAEGKNRVIYE